MVQAVGIKDEVMEMIETISDLSYGWELLGILFLAIHIYIIIIVCNNYISVKCCILYYR